MVLIGYSSLMFCGTCPHCAGPLCELSDMWGPFYACEACGYEFDPLELEPKHLQSVGQPVFAGSFWLDQGNGSDGTRSVWHTSAEVCALPLS